MARWLYSLLWYLATPLIWLRLLWRSRRQPEYRQHLGERHGFYGRRESPPRLIWVHAVSVGETRAAQPLIEGLLARWPGYRILLTGMTPTGREAGGAVYGERVVQAYLPYDYPGATRRFLAHFQPAFGMLMETEIWPNLLAAAAAREVPVILVNARLSARSARGYGRLPALFRPAFAALAGVCAQTADDARRLSALGAAPVEVCGNIKFDVTPAADKLALGEDWRRALGARPVWLAASTREGEEALLLAAWRGALGAGAIQPPALVGAHSLPESCRESLSTPPSLGRLAQQPDAPLPPRGGGAGGEGDAARETAAGSSIALAYAAAGGMAGNAPFFGEPSPLPNPSPAREEGLQPPLLLLVPRHPQRFADVAALLTEQGWNWQQRSAALPDTATQIWLGDSMGEMAAYYRLADLAFIGGSLLPLGGQNLIEAAACACPVLLGPHTFNFLRATEDAIAAGAARRVDDAEALAEAVRALLADAGQLSAMRQAATDFARAHGGAAERMLTLIARWSVRAGC